MKKVLKAILITLLVILVLLIALLIFVPSGSSPSESSPAPSSEPAPSIRFGEILDITENSYDKVVVLKVKIESNLTDKLTIAQNYYNACEFIRTYSGIDYDTLSYWAVADMTDGSESKVISFDVPAATIKGVLDETIVDIELENYVEDLWLHPSLR